MPPPDQNPWDTNAGWRTVRDHGPYLGFHLTAASIAWIEIRKEDLLADWELAVNGTKPFPIRGLDQ